METLSVAGVVPLMGLTESQFPPEVVDYVREGVQFALKSPYPEAVEAAMWVFHEEEE